MTRPEDKTILVVDDEPDIVVYLQTLLEDAGFNVMVAYDGDAAIQAVKERKPDFISLDLVMPKKSGIRFFYELRKNKEWSKIPVVVVTGHARDEKVKSEMDELFDSATMMGPRTYLEKPVKPEDYLNLVRRELGIATPEPIKDAGQGGSLKEKAKRLLDNADPETIAAALKLLEKKK